MKATLSPTIVEMINSGEIDKLYYFAYSSKRNFEYFKRKSDGTWMVKYEKGISKIVREANTMEREIFGGTPYVKPKHIKTEPKPVEMIYSKYQLDRQNAIRIQWELDNNDGKKNSTIRGLLKNIFCKFHKF
jgi:hypothetical protein